MEKMHKSTPYKGSENLVPEPKCVNDEMHSPHNNTLCFVFDANISIKLLQYD